ncbi:uncharacterized protein TNIN_315161 [Trichonephila inaurata madagascariensis]|uniref:Uncharacterized protein n=1 Tax=Trichonephila inaurata madagascariensis TaxID=2747483 RepID=A0A8X6XSX4_9ARAC|nr:uncharacterized protein TNIN_315161 [Trichonephila inaurata madagascariensis]
MDAILKLKKILKGKLTRLVSKIEDFQNQENSVSIIEVYEIDVNTIDIEINNLNDNFLSTCADENFNDYEVEMHGLFSKLDTLKINLKEEMKKLVKNDSNTNACQNINTNVNNLKLPRIELPAFTSNYIDWISFHDLFLSSVGNNNTYSDSQKLQHFKHCTGRAREAATLLQSIQITNDNYKKVWNALMERYENEAEIINAALNKLVSQPVLKQESASGLQKLIDTLPTLKQPVEYWDTLIIFLLRGGELSETKPFTNEEIAFENHFKRTHTRDSTGRFAFNFPFRYSSDKLGLSRDIAVHLLQQIERRFSKNKSLYDQYHKFINDYLKLDHMELIPENEIDVPQLVPVFISRITQYPIKMEINFALYLTICRVLKWGFSQR